MRDLTTLEGALKELEVISDALRDACWQLVEPKELPTWLDKDKQSYVDYFVSRVRISRRNEHRV